MQTKLKNDRKRKRKLNERFDAKDEVNQNMSIEDLEILNSDEEEHVARHLTDFIQCNLPEQLEIAKIKLKKTVQFRRKRDKTEMIKIRENYSGFFVCPELVICPSTYLFSIILLIWYFRLRMTFF